MLEHFPLPSLSRVLVALRLSYEQATPKRDMGLNTNSHRLASRILLGIVRASNEYPSTYDRKVR